MKKLVGLLALAIMLFASCTPNPADDNQDSEGDVSITSQRLSVDLTGATAIASFDFVESTQTSSVSTATLANTKYVDISDIVSYLSGHMSNGLFSPMLFTTDDGTDIILGASRNCNNGNVEIVDTGNGTFLAIFDRLVVIDSFPLLEPIKDALENILDIVLEINAVSVSRKENIAFINTETGEAYLLNSPYTQPASKDLDFRLLDSIDDTYGYSDNRIYLLTKSNALYSFDKNNPERMVSVNNSEFKPLKENATIYTDNYAIYQYTQEELGPQSNGYIEIYNAKNPDAYKRIDMSGSDDPLQNMIFRVGNNLFLRDRNTSDNEYGLTIYPLTVNSDLSLTIGEGMSNPIASGFVSNPEGTIVKNSGISFYGESESFLIRAENYLLEPALIWFKADVNGNLSDINVIRLEHGSYFPYPLSEKASASEKAMFWVDNASSGTIFWADFSSGVLKTIKVDGGLASDELSATGSGNIIYHRYMGNGTDVGTYEYNPSTGKETLISYSSMDVHQIYEI